MICSRAGGGATWRRPTATTTIRSIPIGPRIWPLTGLTSSGPQTFTYVAIQEGFAYVAVILDAWSRRAVGYAISRSIDMRLTLAALNAAIERRTPPPGCIHHSDRGSQGGFKRSSQHLNVGGCDDPSKTPIPPFRAGAVAITRTAASSEAI